jgi:hypothetical protein
MQYERWMVYRSAYSWKRASTTSRYRRSLAHVHSERPQRDWINVRMFIERSKGLTPTHSTPGSRGPLSPAQNIADVGRYVRPGHAVTGMEEAAGKKTIVRSHADERADGRGSAPMDASCMRVQCGSLSCVHRLPCDTPCAAPTGS